MKGFIYLKKLTAETFQRKLIIASFSLGFHYIFITSAVISATLLCAWAANHTPMTLIAEIFGYYTLLCLFFVLFASPSFLHFEIKKKKSRLNLWLRWSRSSRCSAGQRKGYTILLERSRSSPHNARHWIWSETFSFFRSLHPLTLFLPKIGLIIGVIGYIGSFLCWKGYEAEDEKFEK